MLAAAAFLLYRTWLTWTTTKVGTSPWIFHCILNIITMYIFHLYFKNASKQYVGHSDILTFISNHLFIQSTSLIMRTPIHKIIITVSTYRRPPPRFQPLSFIMQLTLKQRFVRFKWLGQKIALKALWYGWRYLKWAY